MKKLITKLTIVSVVAGAVSMSAFAWHNNPLWHDFFSEGLIAVEDLSTAKLSEGDGPGEMGKWGFKDKTGKLVIPYQYDDAREFSEGLAAVETKDGIGFIDHSGNFVIKPNPEFAGLIHEINRMGFYKGLSVMGKVFPANEDMSGSYTNSKGEWVIILYGYINTKGEWVIKPQFTSAWNFDDDGIAAISNENRDGYINTSGQIVGKFEGKDEKYGYKDVRTGEIVLKAIYNDMGAWFGDGLLAVKTGDKWGFVDTTGKVVIKATYEDAGEFSEGLAAVRVNGKWGFIDTKGKMVIKPQFVAEYAPAPFKDGISNIYMGDTSIDIDKTGKEVVVQNAWSDILKQYEDSRVYEKEGVAIVIKDDNYYVIDKTGKVLFQLY